MTKDTKSSVLKDWNDLDERKFVDFNELFRFLEGMSREHGMQSKKEIYKHTHPSIRMYEPTARKELDRITKRNTKATTTTVATFRRRIKMLSKSKKS